MAPIDYAIRRCHEMGLDPAVVRGSYRHQEYVMARREIARELRTLGYSYPAIGRAINRDHSTVMSLLDGDRRPPKRAACWDGLHLCKDCAS